jgi:hypothetical protein
MSWLTRSGGVGLHPVAGLGDPLDPHVRDQARSGSASSRPR